MAHERKRHVLDYYRKLMGYYPIVGIFGHRQVGKSTFVAAEVDDYRTLDDIDQLEAAQVDPKKYIQARRVSKSDSHAWTIGVDECQLEPKLFPTLKEWVRIHKKPGQFVLSGSVRFTSRKAIRESLAGRIGVAELLPFSVSELQSRPLPDAVVQLLNCKIFSQDSLRCLLSLRAQRGIQKELLRYMEQGGLPGLCFLRSEELRKSALNQLHDLILSRDLRLVSELKTPLSTIKKFLGYIARNSFEPYNAAEVRRILGLAPQTQKVILHALESVFVIRRIPVPIRKKEMILLEDQFEERVYSGGLLELQRRLESAVYRNIRTQFAYRLDQNVVYEVFLTRDGARIPIVIRSEGKSLGLIVTTGEKPSLSETRSASSFLRRDGSAKVVYLSKELIAPQILDDRSLLCSIYAVI